MLLIAGLLLNVKFDRYVSETIIMCRNIGISRRLFCFVLRFACGRAVAWSGDSPHQSQELVGIATDAQVGATVFTYYPFFFYQ